MRLLYMLHALEPSLQTLVVLTTPTEDDVGNNMRIPAGAIIADEKLTGYLLVKRPWDDKSGYLGRAGFTLDTWTRLRDAIRSLADSVDAVEDGESEYGTFYRTQGLLAGPKATLAVTLIWMRRASDDRFYFVTLKPQKE